MSRLDQKSVLAAAVAAGAVLAVTRAPQGQETTVAIAAAFASFVAVLWGASQTRELGPLLGAVRRAGLGETVRPPEGSDDETRRVFDELAALAERQRHEAERAAQKGGDLEASLDRSLEHVQKAAVSLEEQAARASELLRTATEMVRMIREADGRAARLHDQVSLADSGAHELRIALESQQKTWADLHPAVATLIAATRTHATATAAGRHRLDAVGELAEETRKSLAEAATSAHETERRLHAARDHASATATEAERGDGALTATLDELTKLRSATREAAVILTTLEGRTQAIGQIVSVIDDVGEQTNLLALNAAIIAAQAGEQGKGFAVVAEEIKELAERATASTREIADLVRTVQTESKNATAAVERGTARLDRGLAAGADTKHILQRIREASAQASAGIDEVARAVEDQERGARRAEGQLEKVTAALRVHGETVAEQASGHAEAVRAAERAADAAKELERAAAVVDRSATKSGQDVVQLRALLSELSSTERALLGRSEDLFRALERLEESSKAQRTQLDRVTSEVLKTRQTRRPGREIASDKGDL